MIKINHLTKKFSDGTRTLTALDDVTLQLPDHGMVFLLGKSGAGKSTLLNLLGGLDSFEGTIEYDDHFKLDGYKPREFDSYRSRHIGYIFQDFYLAESKTVFENIKRQLRIAGITDRDQVILRADQALKAVGMGLYKRRAVRALSLGQKQRVAIARALAINPQLLLADEPTGNLDSENSQAVMEILKKLGEKILVVCVSHSEPLATQFGDYVYRISDGKVTLSEMEKKTIAAPTKATKVEEKAQTKKRDKGELSGIAGDFDTTGFVDPTGKSPLVVKGMFEKIIYRKKKGQKAPKGYFSNSFLTLFSIGMAFSLCIGLNTPYADLNKMTTKTILDPQSEVSLVSRLTNKTATDLDPQTRADIMSDPNSGVVASVGASLTQPLSTIFDDLSPAHGGTDDASSAITRPLLENNEVKIFNAGDGMPESFGDPKGKSFGAIFKDLQADEVAIDRSFADDLARSLHIDNVDDLIKEEHYVNLYDAQGQLQHYRIAKIAEKTFVRGGFEDIFNKPVARREIFVGKANRFDPYWSAAYTNAALPELYTRMGKATYQVGSGTGLKITGDLATYIAGNSPLSKDKLFNAELDESKGASQIVLSGNATVDNNFFENLVTAFTQSDDKGNLLTVPGLDETLKPEKSMAIETLTTAKDLASTDIPVYVKKSFLERFPTAPRAFGNIKIVGTYEKGNAPLLMTANKQLALLLSSINGKDEDEDGDLARFVSIDMDKTIKYLNDKYTNYMAVNSYDLLLADTLDAQKQKQVYIIVGAVLFMVLYALFFRARLIKDVRLIGIYRCLGLKRSSIMVHYFSDIFARLSIFFAVPYTIIAIVMASLGLFAMPVWVALVSVVAFYVATILAVMSPTAILLYKTPHRIMVKYDI